MKIGVHTSISGGLHRSLERANSLGCNTVQIFTHNPRAWNVKKITEEESSLFRTLRTDLSISPIYIHASYLINLASEDRILQKKSINLLINEMERADTIGADYVIVHLGSSADNNKGASRKRIISALTEISESRFWKAGLIIENTAGEKGDISSQIVDLYEIINCVKETLIRGICIDTCHVFAAGYDIRNDKGIKRLFEEIKYYIGLDKFKVIHLNDSKGDLGSKIDRHEHIGAGRIGIAGLKKFLKHFYFTNAPIILETPKKQETDDIENLIKVRKMLYSNIS
ncbi:MAG: deoxyribonuclease IV [Thermodesulfovibrionales bacterium]